MKPFYSESTYQDIDLYAQSFGHGYEHEAIQITPGIKGGSVSAAAG